MGLYINGTTLCIFEKKCSRISAVSYLWKTGLSDQGTINLVPIETETPCDRIYLEKFAFSNAMAASVKLGALESNLDKIIDSIEFLSEDMKRGRPFATSRYVVHLSAPNMF